MVLRFFADIVSNWAVPSYVCKRCKTEIHTADSLRVLRAWQTALEDQHLKNGGF
jgi:hypothetical protein